MKSDRSIYRVFVVRAWAEKDKRSGEIITRYTLEIPKSGEQAGFVTSQALLEELNQELAKLPPSLSSIEPEESGISFCRIYDFAMQYIYHKKQEIYKYRYIILV